MDTQAMTGSPTRIDELPSTVFFLIGAAIITLGIVAPLLFMAAKSKNIFKRHLQLPLR